jgi:AraC-like DNA-binding protein
MSQKFSILPNPDGPGWPRATCAIRGDLGCLAKHAKAVGYRAEALADCLGVTPRELRRVFKDTFGITVKDWLVQVRSVEVRVRLRGDECIEGIAKSVGFSHSKDLAREFQTIYSVTPMSYRRRERSRGERGSGNKEQGTRNRSQKS